MRLTSRWQKLLPRSKRHQSWRDPSGAAESEAQGTQTQSLNGIRLDDNKQGEVKQFSLLLASLSLRLALKYRRNRGFFAGYSVETLINNTFFGSGVV